MFLDATGADLSSSAQRKLERILQRGEFRRAFPGEIGDLSFPPRAVESYAQDLLTTVDLSGVAEAASSRSSSTAPAASPRWSCRRCSVGCPVDVLTVNSRLDDASPTETAAERRQRAAIGSASSWRRPGRRSASGSTRSASG